MVFMSARQGRKATRHQEDTMAVPAVNTYVFVVRSKRTGNVISRRRTARAATRRVAVQRVRDTYAFPVTVTEF